MKREIKFRAWDKKDKIMVDVASMNFWPNGVLSVLEDFDDAEPQFADSYELMQFTGLHDKNGREIYEGDVVSISNHPFQKHKGSLTGIDIEGNYEINWSERDLSWLAGVWKCSETRHYLTVIGNIHENPELLEVEDD